MILFSRVIVGLLLVQALSLPVHAAPRPSRPETGIGVLLVPSFPPDRAGEVHTVVLYREPGIGRISERELRMLPHLGQVVKTAGGDHILAVIGKRGEWLKIAYDDAGREGWIEPERTWTVVPWEDFLKGRSARLLKGLKKAFYALRSNPADDAPVLENLTPDRPLRIIEVRDEQAQVMVELNSFGWLRWRDEDGRLLMAVE